MNQQIYPRKGFAFLQFSLEIREASSFLFVGAEKKSLLRFFPWKSFKKRRFWFECVFVKMIVLSKGFIIIQMPGLASVLTPQ